MNSKLSRWHKKILNKLEELGLTTQIIRKSKHVVVAGTLNNKSFRWVTSSTPSTTIAYKKMIGDLKRELKRCGISEIPSFNMKFLTIFNDDTDIWEIIRQTEREIILLLIKLNIIVTNLTSEANLNVSKKYITINVTD